MAGFRRLSYINSNSKLIYNHECILIHNPPGGSIETWAALASPVALRLTYLHPLKMRFCFVVSFRMKSLKSVGQFYIAWYPNTFTQPFPAYFHMCTRCPSPFQVARSARQLYWCNLIFEAVWYISYSVERWITTCLVRHPAIDGPCMLGTKI